MNRLLPLFLTLIFSNVALAQAPAGGNGAIFSFKETTHDFGNVPLDSPLHCRFEFTNTGNTLLMITGIEPSCHCLSVNWQRGPVMPGEKGSVDVDYAAPIEEGRFDRGLMIVSNAANIDPALMRFELRVTGEGVKELPALSKKKSGVSRTKSRVHKR